ncbi:UvrD-helicase domain-containing protein [Shewanella eurypsychrophilus]|uniref:DNA 3'-5' helicase n=1 Tax=Shewanella eurypsychrophilus TaxID=2593656 RepID=A0ABX6V1V3_9GAMM|nr:MULTISPECIES: DEAD/DEAH box helicase [Shewanella]QPG56572.2 UvrD-helicase domain-containing protein [Shewanella eurypsychrophilus]
MKNVSADTVDIDHIRIGLTLTLTDMKKLLDGDNGLGRVKTGGRKDRLTVKRINVGNVNQGFKKGDVRPFFTARFEMFTDKDDYRNINVFLAEPQHERNKGRDLVYNCEVEFIPTRLSLPIISFILYQFQSVLGPRRYKQLFDKALLLELHTGYTMYGVSQLFAFMTTSDNNVKKGLCYPFNKRQAVETTYVGDRDSHHLIGYDKTLKEIKKFVERSIKGLAGSFERVAGMLGGVDKWLPSQVCSFRLESRQKYSKDPIALSIMPSVKSLLGKVRLLKPKYLEHLPDEQLSLLIKDKSMQPLSAKWRSLFIKSKLKKIYLAFDTDLLNAAINKRLQALLGAILSPQKTLDVKPKENYKQAVNNARKILGPIIDKQLHDSDPIKKIITSKSRAIYVEGCPGAGKTRLIIERIRHLREQNIKPSAICVLAFTNKSAKEFSSRLKEEKLFSVGMVVGTFSSWCNSLLDESNKLKVLTPDSAFNVIKSLIDKRSQIVKKHDEFEIAKCCISIFSHMANFDTPSIVRTIEKVAPDFLEFQLEVTEIYEAYNKYKKDKYRDFNDMFVQMKRSLNDVDFLEKLAKRYKYLVIDEIQDTNGIQWHIITTLYNNNVRLFCVGDPAQSIYGFRGAVRYMTAKFEKQFEGGVRFQLTRNYRSTKPLVKLTNDLRFKIDTNSIGSVSVLKESKKSSELAKIKFCDTLKKATTWLIKDLEINHNSYACQLILCRYNKQVKSIEKALAVVGSDFAERLSLQVMTFHKAKGLQAEHCYVIDPLFSVSQLSTYKEELCNTYVAFTRAEKALTILACETGTTVYGLGSKSAGRKKAKSIFLDMPEQWVEIIG